MVHIHLMQSSMQFSDNQNEKIEDLRDIFMQNFAACGFTEVHSNLLYTLKTIAKEYGYEIYSRHSVALAIKDDFPILASGYEAAHQGHSALRGSFGPRGVLWVRFSYYGETVTVHEGHWITHPEVNSYRAGLFRRMTRVMTNTVIRNGSDFKLSFFMGDVNADPKKDRFWYPFKPKGLLLPIWEELDTTKPTRNAKTIDVIGRYRKDKRVKAVKVITWQRNSDHKAVSAFYEIKPRKRRK